ncbi:MAG: CoA-binding protein [Ilumatobacteraceae bacterium]
MPRVTDIPGEVDLVVVCVPARHVAGVVADCIAKGVRAITIITARAVTIKWSRWSTLSIAITRRTSRTITIKTSRRTIRTIAPIWTISTISSTSWAWRTTASYKRLCRTASSLATISARTTLRIRVFVAWHGILTLSPKQPIKTDAARSNS